MISKVWRERLFSLIIVVVPMLLAAAVIPLRKTLVGTFPFSSAVDYLLQITILLGGIFVGTHWARKHRAHIQFYPEFWRMKWTFFAVFIGVISAFLFFGELAGMRQTPLLLILVIVYAFAEEYLFRGVFISVWRKHMNVNAVIIFQAVLFAIMHQQLYAWYPLGYLVFGILMGLFMRNTRTRALAYPVIAHLTANVLEFVMIAA